jgi:ATP-dependent protease ClpP protease subunit
VSYIKKHWDGDFSLAISFWVNLVLLGFALRAIDIVLSQPTLIESPVSQARAALIFLTVSLAVIYPWQIIGTWRAADNHVEKTKKGRWAMAAKIMITIGVVSTFGNVASALPVYKSLYELATIQDEFSNYSIEVVDDGKVIHFTGGMGFGASEDIERTISTHSNVEGIILDSNGGRIYEGRKFSEIIRENRLNTYTIKGCKSACGTAFISGNKRYLASGANLGFHQYSSAEWEEDQPMSMMMEQELDLALFREKGISESFLNRLFNAESNDMWYPTIQEMKEAGVIHGVIEPSTLRPISYTSPDRAGVDQAMQSVPALDVVKEYEPEIYEVMLTETEQALKDGGSIIEMQARLGGYVELIATKSLPRTSDEAVIEFTEQIVSSMKTLRDIEPVYCLKHILPEQFGTLDITAHLSKDQMRSSLNALGKVIRDRYEADTTPIVGEQEAEELLTQVRNRMGDRLELLNVQGLSNSDDYRQACNAFIEFYEMILQEEKSVAANGLRWVYTPL